MIFSNKPSSTPQAGQSGKIDQLRVRAALQSMDIKFARHPDTTPEEPYWSGWYFGYWGDTTRISFRANQDEVYHASGMWIPRPPAALLDRVMAVCNSWNSQKYWPKVYVDVKDGHLVVFGEFDVDFEGGVGDATLQQQIKCAITCLLQFTKHLEETFPEYRAWMPKD